MLLTTAHTIEICIINNMTFKIKFFEIENVYTIQQLYNNKDINIDDIIKKINEYKNARFHGNKALEYAEKSNNTKREASILLSLSKASFISSKEVNNYLRRYIKINNSILNHEKTLKNQ